ncbi:MAG: MarR family transcriptional regulator [Prolixibacteraceae bacterium]|nr:MarR family transcriptional regulator [Prolixibacteraceae bacterium]
MEHDLDQIMNVILRTSELLEEEMKQESELKDLTTRQLNCIELVRELRNPNLSELATSMNIAKASISVMVERLLKNNYLYKVQSDSDRRSAHIHLTEKGERAADLHGALHQRISELLTNDLTESEKAILIVLLNKSIKTLKK